MNTLATWAASKPGPFVARTEGEVWRLAWRNFNECPMGGITSELDFMMRLGVAGFDVRPTALGGYVLDRVT